ncbi:MAG: response regulator [Desulfarculaceae bacterium]|nr:response regulator [Desulfarculaceae bacterium]
MRRKAEELLCSAPEDVSRLDSRDLTEILHELRVHQAELEIQNEELRRAQVELGQARDLYFDLYELAPVGYLSLDQKGFITRANLTAANLLGLDRSVLIRRPLGTFMDQEGANTFRLFRKALTDSGSKQTCEVGLVPKKGPAIHARLEGIPELDEQGNSTGFRLVMVDITKRKKAEEERAQALTQAQRREKEVRALLQGSQKVQTSHDFQVAARELFDICSGVMDVPAGYVAMLSEDGQENELLFLEAGGLPCLVDPELPMPVRGLRAQCYKTGKPVYENDFAGSNWHKLLPPGHVKLENVLFAPLNVQGRTVGVMGLANKPGGFSSGDARLVEAFGDIAAMSLNNIRLLDGLKNSEKRFHELFNHMSTGVAIYEAQGDGERFVFRHINPAGLRSAGYEEGDVIGHEVREAFPGVEKFGLFEVFQRVWRTGEAEHHPISFYEDERVIQWVENYVFRLPNGDLVAMYDDLTQQKQLEEGKQDMEAQLRQSQKMEAVGTLAGGIAHDFNNILAAIMGYGELAQEKILDGEDASTDIAEILKGAVRASNLVKRILTFSRGMSAAVTALDLNRIVADTAVLLRDTLPRMIELQTDLGADVGIFKGDHTQFEQVIINLATNARDAMPEGGNLLLETSKENANDLHCTACAGRFSGEYIRFRVKDSGTGMDRKTLCKVFDPFFTTKEVGKGTGLGLSMIFGIVQGHSGHIVVESALGEGTTVDIYLPQLEGSVEPETQTAVGEIIAGGDETILLVDDEPAIVNIGGKVLTGAGYKVLSASTGEEAVGIYRNLGRKIDLVVLDLSMPGMGGHKCLRELLSLSPELKIIVSTGYARDGDLDETMSDGAAALLSKPFKIREMLEIVRQVLDA